MIKAVFTEDQEGRLIKYSIKGHAKYSPFGTDIVCAAVSALAISTANGIVAYCDTDIDSETSDNGEMVINVLHPNDKSDVLISSMILGMQSIAETYKNNVELTLEAPEIIQEDGWN